MDLSRAFDCVQHDILLTKLHFYGVTGKELRWFEDYLTQTTQVLITAQPWGRLWQKCLRNLYWVRFCLPYYTNSLPGTVFTLQIEVQLEQM